MSIFKDKEARLEIQFLREEIQALKELAASIRLQIENTTEIKGNKLPCPRLVHGYENSHVITHEPSTTLTAQETINRFNELYALLEVQRHLVQGTPTHHHLKSTHEKTTKKN